MSPDKYIVIMAGGIGSRFWPYSRNSRPKQFLDVLGTGRTLLQMTYDRFMSVTSPDKVFVVTNTQYAEQVAEQLPELTPDQILLEPERRNTAPCIAYAAYKIRTKDPEAIMVVTPADHTIFNEHLFVDSINTAAEGALEDKLITIGIKPNRPETGYGYIQYLDTNDNPVKRVKTFTEKPQLDLAEKFIESGDFVWNAGIFVWSVSAIVKAFEENLPEISELFEEGKDLYYTEAEQAFINKTYTHSKSISVDYGIMESASNVYMVMGEFVWSDLGSWASLHDVRDKNEDGNVVEANALLYDCKDSFVKGPKDKVMVLQDLEGYLVADFDDVLIVCKKDQDSKFREFFSDVKSKKGDKFM
ncbi:MAG: mannose-1-phosphate guanylyltransferase [Cyclobacteriaceae bacterium]